MAKDKIANAFSPVPNSKTPKGSAGFDNARENIDPHVRTQVVTSKQGTLQDAPINNKDLVNKEYTDANFVRVDGSNNMKGDGVNFLKLNMNVSADDNTALQLLPLAHDSAWILFDCYYNGTNFRSSDAGSNFLINKVGDTLRIQYDAGVTVGDAISPNTALTIDNSGNTAVDNLSATAISTDTINEATGNRGVTIDGALLKDGIISLTSIVPEINLFETDQVNKNWRIRGTGGELKFQTMDDNGTNADARLTIDQNGNSTFERDIKSSGDTFWTNDGSGIPYGAMGQENIPTTVTIGTIGVPVIVDGMSGGETNLITFQNSQELKVTKAGRYFITWAVSFNMASGSGQEVEGTIGKGGVSQSVGSSHRKIGTGNDTGSMCGTTILDLAANDLITIMVANESTTVNVVVAHASLTMSMVGGT